MSEKQFKVGDIVQLCGCPYDTQIEEEMEEFVDVVFKKHLVTEIKNSPAIGHDGQWIKTDLISDFTDSSYFVLKEEI